MKKETLIQLLSLLKRSRELAHKDFQEGVSSAKNLVDDIDQLLTDEDVTKFLLEIIEQP